MKNIIVYNQHTRSQLMQIPLNTKKLEEIIADINDQDEIEVEEVYYKLWEDDRI